jgi:hypothetical protein
VLYHFIVSLSIVLWGHLICGVLSVLVDYFIIKMYEDRKEIVEYIDKTVDKQGFNYTITFPMIIVICILTGYFGLYKSLRCAFKRSRETDF